MDNALLIDLVNNNPASDRHFVKHFGSMNAAELLSEYIEPAKEGRRHGLYSLYYIIQTRNGRAHILTVLDIYLSNLGRDLIPEEDHIDILDIEALDNAEKGLLSLIGLKQLFDQLSIMTRNAKDAVEAENRLIRPLIARLEPLLDDVTLWLIFAISRSPRTYLSERNVRRTNWDFMVCAAGIIKSGKALDGHLGACIRYSRGIADVLVRMWLMKNRDVDYSRPPPIASDNGEPYTGLDEYYLTFTESSRSKVDSDPGCFLIETAADTFARDLVMRRSFIRKWVAVLGEGGIQVDPFVVLADTIISRVSQVHRWRKAKLYDDETAWKNVSALADIVRFLKFPDPDKYQRDDALQQRISTAFLKSNYAALFTDIFLDISDSCFIHERSRRFPQRSPSRCALPLRCFDSHNKLVIDVMFLTSYGAIDCLRTMVKHGLLQIAGNAAATLICYTESYRNSLQEKFKNNIAGAVKLVLIYSIASPTIAREAVHAETSVSEAGRTAIDWAMRTLWGVKSSDFKRQVALWDGRYRTFKKTWKWSICDSEDCIQKYGLGRRDEGKACSGCLSAVYCSVGCQRDDWDVRHRFECKELYAFYKGVKPKEMVHTHLYRSWHIQFMKIYYSEWQGFKTHLTHPPSSIMLIDARAYPFESSMRPISEYDSPSKEFALVKELDKRFYDDFLEWAQSRQRFEQREPDEAALTMTRLVEGAFMFGDTTVMLALKLRITMPLGQIQKGNGSKPELMVLDSITRTGLPREDVPSTRRRGSRQ